MARLRIALLAALVLAAAGALVAQDTDTDKAPEAPAGTWKLTMVTLREAQGRPILVVRLTKKEGKWDGEIVASALKGKTALEKVSVLSRSKLLRFTIKTQNVTWPCVVKLPPDARGKMYGESVSRQGTMPLEMERTNLQSLDLFDQDREALAKEALGMRAITLALTLLQQAEEKKAKAGEVRSWADKAVRSAQLYGPGVQRDILLGIANVLGEQKGLEAVALEYARRAEAGLDDKEGPAAHKRVLGILADVLEQAKKKDEADKVRARIKKLDFRVKLKPYAGRKARSDRVVLAEMFTGAQANPAVATTMASAALLQTFKPAELALVEYHLHLTQPDPLACGDGEERFGFYKENIKGLPVMILNGKVFVPGGGGEEDAQERYDSYVEAIEPLLENEAAAGLTVKATRKGNTVNITAEVSKLTTKDDDIRLRLVLVEPTVSYKGANGQTIHHNVARATPGGVEGTVLKTRTAKKTYAIDLADLRKKITAYLDKVKVKRDFPDKERPLDLKALKVIAFIQNDATGEVLQTAQADVQAAE